MTIRVVIRMMLAIALCVGSGCSGEVADAAGQGATPAAGETPTAVSASAGHVLATPAEVYGCPSGRNCRVACGTPEAPAHGNVWVRWLPRSAMAVYACSAGYDLVGAAIRTCQASGTWSGTPTTCTFAGAGSSCGSCGGTYDADGNCSVGTPANLGSPCDVGSGRGACAGGGTVVCGGICQPAEPTIADASKWHIAPAPNGSWDWDCDDVVTTTLVPTTTPPECSTYADSQDCNGASTVEFVTEACACGQQATLFKRDCDWKTLGPTCLDTPAGHRVVFQQCR